MTYFELIFENYEFKYYKGEYFIIITKKIFDLKEKISF
jgi:hypothetical protein